MNFSTKVHIASPKKSINYQEKIILMGSCFSENIGQKFTNAYFQTIQNPFGILYNPASISAAINTILSDKLFTKDRLTQHNDLWHSPLHHGIFSDSNQENCLKKINKSLIAAREFISETDVLILTFGTAWIYEQNGEVVGNCHKIPAQQFTRRRLSCEEIVSDYKKLIGRLLKLQTKMRIIFTVSPVRHWKDGAHENQLSKSTLHLAIDELCRIFPDTCTYFPSYEIVIDELRDYRYYSEDMLHPNSIAVNYIWERFSEIYFDEESTKQKKELEQLHRDLTHRPIHSATKTYQKFLLNVQKKHTELKEKFPWI